MVTMTGTFSDDSKIGNSKLRLADVYQLLSELANLIANNSGFGSSSE